MSEAAVTPPVVRIYSGVRSPYSRLGMHILHCASADADMKISVYPFLGPPDGVPFSNPTDNPLKLAYILQDAPRMARRLGLEMRAPVSLDPNFKPANLAQLAATRDGFGLAFAVAIADARWAEEKDIGDLAVLAACAEAIGWSGDAVHAAQASDAMSSHIEETRQRIAQDGVFGVPFAVVDDGGTAQKYWGHDRFALIVERFTNAG